MNDNALKKIKFRANFICSKWQQIYYSRTVPNYRDQDYSNIYQTLSYRYYTSTKNINASTINHWAATSTHCQRCQSTMIKVSLEYSDPYDNDKMIFLTSGTARLTLHPHPTKHDRGDGVILEILRGDFFGFHRLGFLIIQHFRHQVLFIVWPWTCYDLGQ
jgi:hypothetical protein